MRNKNKKVISRPEEKNSLREKLMSVTGLVLCLILAPVLLINCTLLARSFMNPDEVPSVGGIFPMIVLTDSMNPDIQSGDLIFCHTVDPSSVQTGDVISFYDPEGNGTSVVTHQVIEILDEDGLAFRTQGTANNAPDATPVPAESLVGMYKTRIPGAGNLAIFMQTSTGLIVCAIVPMVLLVGYDMIRRRRHDKRQARDTEALLEQLKELKAMQAAQAQPE